MKKLLAVAILGLAAVSSWAQGTVDFRNGATITFSTPGDRLVYSDHVGGTKLTGTTYVAGLYYVVGAGTVDAGGILLNGVAASRTFNFRSATTTSPGTWVIPAGVSPLLTLIGVDVAGNVAGLPQLATLQVRVWDSAQYSSWDAALAGGHYGVSAPFAYSVPDTGSAPNKYYMENLQAFALIPEPSTIALGVLGAASLLFLRRRK